MGVAAIILGIFGIIFGWFPIIQYFALGLSVIGIVLAAVGIGNSDKTGKGKGSAIAGLVLCIMATILSGIGVFICTAATASAVSNTPGALDSLQKAAESLEGVNNSLQGIQDSADNVKNSFQAVQDAADALKNTVQ